MNLRDYLATLNSAEEIWGVWVNPADLNDYRIDRYSNEEQNDGKVFIGSLAQLSYGYQDQVEAIESFLTNWEYRKGVSKIWYQGKWILCDIKGIVNAWKDDLLDLSFRVFLENEGSDIEAEWSRVEADLKIEELEEFFAPDGEYEHSCREKEIELVAWQAC